MQYSTTKLFNITNNPTTLGSEPIWYYMEMFHNPTIKPLELDERIINPIGFIKATLKEFDEFIINLVINSE